MLEALITVMIIFMFVLIIMLVKMATAFRKFMLDEIQEAVIGSSEDITARLDSFGRDIKKLSIMLGKFEKDSVLLTQVHDDFVKNMNDEIKHIQRIIIEASAAMGNMSVTQEEVMKNLAGNINDLTKRMNDFKSILEGTTGNIQSAFNKTDDELKRIIANSMKEIEKDYEQNLKRVFQIMADNLTAIHKKFSSDINSLKAANESRP